MTRSSVVLRTSPEHKTQNGDLTPWLVAIGIIHLVDLTTLPTETTETTICTGWQSAPMIGISNSIRPFGFLEEYVASKAQHAEWSSLTQ